MVTLDLTTDDAVLLLLALDEELAQECEMPTPCTERVEWLVTCRPSGCEAHVCTTHQRYLAKMQRFNDEHRRGQACTGCRVASYELMIFTPLRSSDEAKLW